jgi:hypothetical protein
MSLVFRQKSDILGKKVESDKEKKLKKKIKTLNKTCNKRPFVLS